MTGKFAQIERLFDELLAASSESLSAGGLQEVRHFIEVGEFGLALETMVDIFAEEKKAIGNNVTSQINDLAREMSIDPAPLLRRLPQ